MLAARVLHADETLVAMRDPGEGKTKRAYVWAYSRGAFDAVPGVIYDFCAGRGARFTQLYPSFSSASMARIFILKDLFVRGDACGKGLCRKLIGTACEFAKAGACYG